MTETLASMSLDLFGDEERRNPWPFYVEIRNSGPVVRLENYDFYAVGRYDDVRQVLGDQDTFISSEGVGLNDMVNQQMKGTLIASNGQEHENLRKVAMERLTAPAMREIADRVQEQVDEFVDVLVGSGRIDAISRLSRKIPMHIVGDMIGFDQEARDKMFHWTEFGFNAFGPMNVPRTMTDVEAARDMFEYAFRVTRRGSLRPGSLGDAIIDAVEEGRISPEQGPTLMVAYLSGGIDTTVAAISSMLRLFGENPAQWAKLKADPELAPQAVNEILRMYPPIHWFSRLAAKDTHIGGVPVLKGSRILPLFGAANRDERKFNDPDSFDITRDAKAHLAFGFGRHVCAGQFIAKLELVSLARALATKVDRIELHEAEWAVHNIVHSHSKLDVTFH